MQVGRARFSWEEKDRQREKGLILYCGAAGHLAAKCPVKDQARPQFRGYGRVHLVQKNPLLLLYFLFIYCGHQVPTPARRWLIQELKGEPVDLSNLPTEYSDLKEVFRKSRAAFLPLHRPYDCAIDLLPGTCSACQASAPEAARELAFVKAKK